MNLKIEASCALIPHPYDENLFLGISRKNNHDDFGLIGGKLEEGESARQALSRELWEESGIEIDGYDNKVVYLLSEIDDNSLHVVTYFIQIDPSQFEEIKTQKNEGIVRWVSKEKLIAGSFGNYNKKLFSIFEEKYKPVKTIRWFEK